MEMHAQYQQKRNDSMSPFSKAEGAARNLDAQSKPQSLGFFPAPRSH